MLNLNSFNHLLPVSNTSTHLIRGLIASALLSISLVSASSHANASNSANSVKVPGYATVDFNAYWNINPTVKIFTNIQNIGDVQYREVYKAASSWDNSPEDWYINGGRFASAGVTFRY